MSKELKIITEYIEKIEEYEKKTGKQYLANYMTKELCIAIKEKLQRLEVIDNANPSEALKSLKELDYMDFHRSINIYVPEIDNDVSETQYLSNTDEFYIIKQALLKAQEQEKVLSIINEKEVNMQVFNQCEDVETYNKVYIKQKDRQLTEEEFDLLKGVLG